MLDGLRDIDYVDVRVVVSGSSADSSEMTHKMLYSDKSPCTSLHC